MVETPSRLADQGSQNQTDACASGVRARIATGRQPAGDCRTPVRRHLWCTHIYASASPGTRPATPGPSKLLPASGIVSDATSSTVRHALPMRFNSGLPDPRFSSSRTLPRPVAGNAALQRHSLRADTTHRLRLHRDGRTAKYQSSYHGASLDIGILFQTVATGPPRRRPRQSPGAAARFAHRVRRTSTTAGSRHPNGADLTDTSRRSRRISVG